MANEFKIKHGIRLTDSPTAGSSTDILARNATTGIVETVTGIEVSTLSDKITREFSGFVGQNDGNDDITVTYNSASRKITLAGTFKAYYQGVLILNVTAGTWTSDPHPSGVITAQFLKYGSNGFEWQSTTWNFHEVQIAYVCVNSAGTYCFAQREVHGLMDWESHNRFHDVIGTNLKSGGDLSDYVLASTAAAARRPLISAASVYDEDLLSVITALSTETYCAANLTGTGTVNFTTAYSDIVHLLSNNPYYNSFVTPNWTQTLMPNNSYQAIFVAAIPTTDDATALSHRYVFFQGQQTSVTLSVIQALTTANITLGDFASISPEFVFIAKIIVRYTGSNWQLTQVDKITGNKVSQLSTPVGSFLSSVSVDDITITGDGTTGNPLVATAGTGSIPAAYKIFLYNNFR